MIGTGEIAVVLYGISRTVRANKHGAQIGKQQERESQCRHTEVMATLDMQRRALDTLIERTVPTQVS